MWLVNLTPRSRTPPKNKGLMFVLIKWNQMVNKPQKSGRLFLAGLRLRGVCWLAMACKSYRHTFWDSPRSYVSPQHHVIFVQSLWTWSKCHWHRLRRLTNSKSIVVPMISKHVSLDIQKPAAKVLEPRKHASSKKPSEKVLACLRHLIHHFS